MILSSLGAPPTNELPYHSKDAIPSRWRRRPPYRNVFDRSIKWIQLSHISTAPSLFPSSISSFIPRAYPIHCHRGGAGRGEAVVSTPVVRMNTSVVLSSRQMNFVDRIEILVNEIVADEQESETRTRSWLISQLQLNDKKRQRRCGCRLFTGCSIIVQHLASSSSSHT